MEVGGERAPESGIFCGMDTKLMITAARRGGWFSRADALSAGYSDVDIRSRLEAGRWVRLTRGAYAQPGPDFEAAASWDRKVWLHLRTARAVYHRLDPRVVVSHQSAALLHGLRVAELDLTRVHVTKLSGAGRSGPLVCQHAARPAVDELIESDGVRMTAGGRAVVETIRAATYPVAVSVVDQALRRRVATAEELAAALRLFVNRPGIGVATRAVLFADSRAESPGESRLRVLLADLGFPAPSLQVEIYDVDGRFVARVDFLWERWGLIVEFDGAVKYGGGGAETLMAEKVREDRLRDLGYQVVRVSWSDLHRPAELLGRLQRALARSLPSSIAGHFTTSA